MKIWNFIYGWPRTNRSLCEHGASRGRPGLRTYSSRVLLAACASGIFSSSYAAEDEQGNALPDLEFLEFLGQFETDAGEWIDPDSLQTEELSELLELSAAADTDDESLTTNDAANNDQ